MLSFLFGERFLVAGLKVISVTLDRGASHRNGGHGDDNKRCRFTLSYSFHFPLRLQVGLVSTGSLKRSLHAIKVSA